MLGAVPQTSGRPGWEGRFEVRKLSHARPDLLRGCAQDTEDPEQLVNLWISLEMFQDKISLQRNLLEKWLKTLLGLSNNMLHIFWHLYEI